MIEIIRTGWDAFWGLATFKFVPVGVVKLSAMDFMLFIAVLEILIWFIHAIAGRKGDEQ